MSVFNNIFNTGITAKKQMDEFQEQRKTKKYEKFAEQLNKDLANPDFALEASSNFQDLMVHRPELANAIATNYTNLSNQRKRLYVEDFSKAGMLADIGDKEGALDVLIDRYNGITERGGKASDTARAINILNDDLQNGTNNFSVGVQEMIKVKQGLDGKKNNWRPQISPVYVEQTGDNAGQQYVVVTDPNTQETRKVLIQGGKALTEDDKIKRQIRQDLVGEAIKQSTSAFEKLEATSKTIGIMEQAITQIDDGARSGFIQDRLPALRASTIQLRNLKNQLGLQIVAGTTFGALSEKELQMAMDTGAPPLDEADLKIWLQERVDAQKKAYRELSKMARELGTGKVTLGEYIEKNTKYVEENEKEDSDEVRPAPTPTQPQQVINWADM